MQNQRALGCASHRLQDGFVRALRASKMTVAVYLAFCILQARSFTIVPTLPPRATGFTQSAFSTIRMATERAESDWRKKGRPITNGKYPAKDLCSRCGICDSYFVAKVKEACPFLEDGMSKIERMEEKVHGKARDEGDREELFFGVHKRRLLCRVTEPVAGAQWGGLVTTIACCMLDSGMVDAVLCVASEDGDPLAPRPILARTVDEVLSSRGVKPVLTPTLRLLPLLEDASVRKLLACGVGCQVQALREVEELLNLEKLYVVGTNCVDNAPARRALDKFLHVASDSPDSVASYEFMPDYNVHINHRPKQAQTSARGSGDALGEGQGEGGERGGGEEEEGRGRGGLELVPFFTLPAHELKDVIAPSCYSCFDYSNALADIVVGYMSAPYQAGVRMGEHWQSVTVRNDRGEEMLRAAGPKLHVTDNTSGEGQSWLGANVEKLLVRTTVDSDDAATLGELTPLGPHGWGAPKWVGLLIGGVLTRLGPAGEAFGRYSIAYHYARNSLFLRRRKGEDGARRRTPSHAQTIISRYFDEQELQSKAGAAPPLRGLVGGVQDVPYGEWDVDRARAAGLLKRERETPPAMRRLERMVAAALGLPEEEEVRE